MSTMLPHLLVYLAATSRFGEIYHPQLPASLALCPAERDMKVIKTMKQIFFYIISTLFCVFTFIQVIVGLGSPPASQTRTVLRPFSTTFIPGFWMIWGKPFGISLSETTSKLVKRSEVMCWLAQNIFCCFETVKINIF